MDIFESLENLNVSEGCFEDIINIVEDILNEREQDPKKVKEFERRERQFIKKAKRDAQLRGLINYDLINYDSDADEYAGSGEGKYGNAVHVMQPRHGDSYQVDAGVGVNNALQRLKKAHSDVSN